MLSPAVSVEAMFRCRTGTLANALPPLFPLGASFQITPWSLTSNFVEAVREGRGQLALIGVGDPTGRGYGYSFTKEVRKQTDPTQLNVPRRDAGTITGFAPPPPSYPNSP